MAGIAIITERALPQKGGLAKAASRIAALSTRGGERVHLITLSKDASPGGRGRDQRGDVVVHPVGPLERQDESLLALAAHAREVIAENDLDVVHGLYGTSGGYVAALLGRELGHPSVVSLRGNDLDRGLFRAADLPMLSFALERATVVTAVSAALQRQAEALWQRGVVHVSNSVDSDLFLPEGIDNTLRAALGLGDSDVIGFSGELREKKGMRFLLPAFAALCDRRDVRLLLLGGVREDAAAAMEAFKEAAPAAHARVHITEHTSDPKRLSKLYGLCDVLVFPSLVEGTPNAVLEAMACQRPVLASRVGGHPDLIQHGETGALLGLDQLDQLPEAMEEMLNLTDAEARRLGKSARAYVTRHHTPAREAEAWAQVYSQARAATV